MRWSSHMTDCVLMLYGSEQGDEALVCLCRVWAMNRLRGCRASTSQLSPNCLAGTLADPSLPLYSSSFLRTNCVGKRRSISV